MPELCDGDMILFLKAKYIQILQDIFIIQRAYLNIKLIDMIHFQYVSTLMVEKLKLQINMNMPFCNPKLYQLLIGKLIQLQYT